MIESIITWHKFPEDPPEQLEYRQYLRYMVALESGYVLECSWLDSGWHERHDGCSNITGRVIWWSEKPKAPKQETGTKNEQMGYTVFEHGRDG